LTVDLIGVHQHPSQMKLRSCPTASRDFLVSLTQSGDRITRARIQAHNFYMEGLVGLTDKVVQDLSISRSDSPSSRIPYGTAAAFAAAMMLVASSGRRKRCLTREFAAAVTLAT
jgi:hypothetical protein